VNKTASFGINSEKKEIYGENGVLRDFFSMKMKALLDRR
jgi:hypothetical protein